MYNDQIQEVAKKIQLLILDVDGVLTDGKIHYTAEGETIKAFNVKDGLGMKVLQDHGVALAILTARTSLPLTRRMQDLGVKYFYDGVANKKAVLEEIFNRCNVTADQVAYVGDDVIDIPVMEAVALPIAVADATELVLDAAKWVTQKNGGQGAVREVCDFLLTSRMTLQEAYQKVLDSKR